MGTRKILRRILPMNLWGDRLYASYLFYRRNRRFPEKRPVRFNDHLFALRTSGWCYDPLIQFVADKEYAKTYISAVLGSEHVIETYRILRSKDEIENYHPDRLPCVLKPTHSSGQVVMYTDPSVSLDRLMLKKWLSIDYYKSQREHHYRYLVPKIIVEEFFSEDGHTAPKDYKIFCFHGVPEIIQVDSNRFSGLTRNFYDTSWARISATIKYPNGEKSDPKPALLEDMLHAAQELSVPFLFVRVDMYATETELKVGELTVMPGSASQPLQPAEAQVAWGELFSSKKQNNPKARKK